MEEAIASKGILQLPYRRFLRDSAPGYYFLVLALYWIWHVAYANDTQASFDLSGPEAAAIVAILLVFGTPIGLMLNAMSFYTIGWAVYGLQPWLILPNRSWFYSVYRRMYSVDQIKVVTAFRQHPKVLMKRWGAFCDQLEYALHAQNPTDSVIQDGCSPETDGVVKPSEWCFSGQPRRSRWYCARLLLRSRDEIVTSDKIMCKFINDYESVLDRHPFKMRESRILLVLHSGRSRLLLCCSFFRAWPRCLFTFKRHS